MTRVYFYPQTQTSSTEYDATKATICPAARLDLKTADVSEPVIRKLGNYLSASTLSNLWNDAYANVPEAATVNERTAANGIFERFNHCGLEIITHLKHGTLSGEMPMRNMPKLRAWLVVLEGIKN
jgi:hypothetical protein